MGRKLGLIATPHMMLFGLRSDLLKCVVSFVVVVYERSADGCTSGDYKHVVSTGKKSEILPRLVALRDAALASEMPIISVNVLEAVDGVNQSFCELEERYGLKPFDNWRIADPEHKFPSCWRVAQTSGAVASGLSHLDVARMADQLPRLKWQVSRTSRPCTG